MPDRVVVRDFSVLQEEDDSEEVGEAAGCHENQTMETLKELITLGGHRTTKHRLYTGTWDGKVVEIVNGAITKSIRFTKEVNCATYEGEPLCGRPLGIRRLNSKELVVADAYLGIFVVDFEANTFKKILDGASVIDGERLHFCNDLDVLDKETILFSDSSTRWDRRRFLHSIMEMVPNGRVIKLNVKSGKAEVVAKGLYFANGVQLFPDKKSFLVAETGAARITRVYLNDGKEVVTEKFIENLPGFPDNIRLGTNGTLWVGLSGTRHSGRISFFDFLVTRPLIRSVLLAIVPEHLLAPSFNLVKPKHAIVVQISQQGKIVSALHDPDGEVIEDVSQVSDDEEFLYFGSFHSNFIGKLRK
uniref:Str_synth domain-containing protein n=1 Tax=Steinernema glaseri TaxID=37863 RepID=A0A1I7ZFT3_9BILA